MFRPSDTLSNVSLIYNNSQVYFCGEILSNLIKSACLIVINQIGKIVYLLYIIVKYTISHAFILSYVSPLVNSNTLIFVETKKLSNGDVEHVYEKVTTPAPTPTPGVEKSEQKAQPKRLANTGGRETNTGLAGMGLAMFGGLLAATKRRKNNKN